MTNTPVGVNLAIDQLPSGESFFGGRGGRPGNVS